MPSELGLYPNDWGSTQSSNKREEEIACFYFTNLRTYILYRMFGLFITIKYHPTIPNLYKYYPLLVWKIYEPPDLFLSPRCLEESKAHWRCMCCVLFTWHLAVLPVHRVYSLAIYTFPFPCLISSDDSFFQRRQLADPITFI